MKKTLTILTFILTIIFLAACSNNSTSSSSSEKSLTIGATSGPYSDMVQKAIKPILEEKGYTVKVVEFSDYIQPNLALGNGDLDANLFQHKIYMETFAEENNLDLSEVIIVPTAPMGIYSQAFESIDAIEEGSEIAIPNDPTNLARALLILQEEGLITLDPNTNPLTVSEKDVEENIKNLVIKPIEAGQLPRSVESVDLAAVPGNYALAANMDLLDAIALENMPDDYRNRVVVNTKHLNERFVQDIREAVESAEFEQVIDEEFQGFGKPEWMNQDN
ncbi:MetQ/NlpA family ABC transporter substrate-binding protein [Bacillus kexueae]|uniref:MetQ/NlpA family ABC transporter substrate-binding protein n=1 Tax=Aeribacillus kexueae TaxID=2078952 RepID=UPI001FAFA284|nr:MetQ/NlpA family ABC transporter substrate-binding protein [Bacillus kexueae]